MEKRNKGFTLIELLATIAILGIIITIAVFSFVNIRKSVNEKQYQSLASTIKTAAKGYAEDTGISKMFVQTLIDEGLVEVDNETKMLHDPRSNTPLNCQVVTFDGDKVTISEDENPVCDITILNDVAIKIQYTNDYGEKEDLKDNVWFNKSITLSVTATGAVPLDLTKATYAWSSPLAPDTTYTRETLTIDNDYVSDIYQVVVSIDDKKYRAYAKVQIDKTEPRSYNLVDKNPSDWKPNKTIEFELSDTGSGIDSWQLSFDKYTEPTTWNKIANPGSKNEKITHSVNLTGLKDGEPIYIWVKDVVGNTNKSQLSSPGSESGLKINTIDGDVDKVTLTGNPGSGTYASKITLTGTLQDSKSGITGYICSKSASAPAVNAGGWTSVTRTNAEISVNCPDTLVDANTDYYIHAKDEVGNVKTAKYTVSNFDNKIDLYDVQDTTNTGYRERTTLRATATDNGAGIVAYAFTTSTATPGTWTPVSKRNYLDVSFTADSNTTYYFHVKDNAGNTAYKPVTVSNIVAIKPYQDHLTSKNSTISKNYNLSGAVQLIRVETNTGTASGNLYGNNVSVTVTGGRTYTEYVPGTCNGTVTTNSVVPKTNCNTYSCDHGGDPNENGMCTGESLWVQVPYTEYNRFVCAECKEIIGIKCFIGINVEDYDYTQWYCGNDSGQGTNAYFCDDDTLQAVSGPWTLNRTRKASINCLPPDYEAAFGCTPSDPIGEIWRPTGPCENYYEWNGDYPATCTSSTQTYVCPDASQKQVGSLCYSCPAGQTLTASNTCEYACQIASSYWQYDITIYYYVIK